MGIRLNKVLSELNIGLQTAVDFLRNKRSLGEVKEDANLSTKISDDQYAALVSEFKRDKDVKAEAGKIFPKKEKKKEEKKAKPEVVEPSESVRQQFKPLGKIDLDSLNKRPAASTPKETPKQETAVERLRVGDGTSGMTLLGEGTHLRFIVDKEKFMSRL